MKRYNQSVHRAGKHRRRRRTALPMREITIALIIVLLILSAICFVVGFTLLNLVMPE